MGCSEEERKAKSSWQRLSFHLNYKRIKVEVAILMCSQYVQMPNLKTPKSMFESMAWIALNRYTQRIELSKEIYLVGKIAGQRKRGGKKREIILWLDSLDDNANWLFAFQTTFYTSIMSIDLPFVRPCMEGSKNLEDPTCRPGMWTYWMRQLAAVFPIIDLPHGNDVPWMLSAYILSMELSRCWGTSHALFSRDDQVD